MSESRETAAALSERRVRHSSLPPPDSHASASSTDVRIFELEIENSRLQRLVAELLLKNQQLRREQE